MEAHTADVLRGSPTGRHSGRPKDDGNRPPAIVTDVEYLRRGGGRSYGGDASGKTPMFGVVTDGSEAGPGSTALEYGYYGRYSQARSSARGHGRVTGTPPKAAAVPSPHTPATSPGVRGTADTRGVSVDTVSHAHQQAMLSVMNIEDELDAGERAAVSATATASASITAMGVSTSQRRGVDPLAGRVWGSPQGVHTAATGVNLDESDDLVAELFRHGEAKA